MYDCPFRPLRPFYHHCLSMNFPHKKEDKVLNYKILFIAFTVENK